ncbi:4572_t:CDS:2, partial [Ambispora leptoticha]
TQMSDKSKKFCKQCKEEVGEGKEVKIKKTLKVGSSSNYRASYYLCPNCYDKLEQELASKKESYAWAWILGGTVVLVIIIVAASVIDDNPNICRSILNEFISFGLCRDCRKENKKDCVRCPKELSIVGSPYYPAIEKQHDERVLLVKQEVRQKEEIKTENINNFPLNQKIIIWDYIISRSSKRGEHKKEVIEGLYLLGWKVGLRISEALNFDLSLEHGETQYKNLYLLRGKGKKESKFLEQVKKEMNIAENIELSPHTLRRCFATYQAISGMPLPVLQK